MGLKLNLVRAASGGKSKRGGTRTTGGGGSLFNQFPILVFVPIDEDERQ